MWVSPSFRDYSKRLGTDTSNCVVATESTRQPHIYLLYCSFGLRQTMNVSSF